MERMMEMEFIKMCRICLKEDADLTYLYSDRSDDIPLSQKIMACSSVQVFVGDGYPEMICPKCSVQAGIAYEFREKCVSADAMLRKYMLVMTPFLKPTCESLTIKDNETEQNSFLELDTDFQLHDNNTNETSVYDFDKDMYSSEVDTQMKDETDSDEPLVKPRKKKQLKEKKGKKENNVASESGTDSDKKKLKEEKDVECPICKKTFAYMCILKDHLVQHTGARPYLCSVCGKSFAHTASLTNHMKTHYTNKPHKCDRCELSFHRKAHLVLHMRTHTGEKPFVCEICGRDFAQNSYLKEHLRVHSGEKPFKCDICNHGFARKSCLVMHRRVHTGELPYACPECGRSFSQRSQRKRHVKRNHKGSACLRDTGELILKDLDLRNKRLQERYDLMLNDGSVSPQRSADWPISNVQTVSNLFNEPVKDNFNESTNELCQESLLTLRLPKALL